MRHILKCKQCKTYTLLTVCPSCGGDAVTPLPAKYSPEDRYAKYRRIAKEESEE